MTLTANGFERPRLSSIKTQYDALVTESIGPVNTNADSVIGQLEGIWAEGVDNSYECLQDTYDSMYPFSAEGSSLDGAVAFVGMSRIPASYTVVTACAYGTEGTLVPIGALCHADITYASTSDVIISRANALDVVIEVNTVANSTTYNIFAGGASSTYTSDASATKAEIVAGLAALVNSSLLTASATGETLRITAKDGESAFAITVDSKLTITKRGSPVVFVASEIGAKVCPVGALINIDTPVSGLDEVYNLKAGAVGRDIESDTDLRARHASGVRATGSATVEAIKSRMLADVDSVTSIQIYENRTNVTTSDMIPPHAFEAVVVGGADTDVAAQLWLTKPAGIETYGNVTVNVKDTTGDVQVVRFSRPAPQYVWVIVHVDSLYPEEVLPYSAVTLIKDSIKNYGDTIGNGVDIILQRLEGVVYANVTGIAHLTVTAAITPSEFNIPVYSSSNIPIGKSQDSIFSTTRISVTGLV